MKTAIRKLAASLLVAAAAACFAADAPHAPEHLPPGIAWRQGDVDAAFAEAKRTNKPLFLYWGAVWCPSCNQVKSTIFSQQAFKSRSSFFVPVYLDGDTENAQKIGDRFKVRGYPTMILFRPDGTEVTRLPGEVDLDRYMQALSIGLNASHPFKQTLAAALKDGARVTPDEWRVLADYSWDTDGDLPVPGERVAATLQALARHARADHANAQALRLDLKAAVSAAAGDPPQQGDVDKAAAAAAVRDALRDPKRARADYDVLVAAPAEVVAYLAGGDAAARALLAKQYDAALARLSTDASLAAIDRTMALHGRVRVARLDARPGAPLPPALADAVRRQTASAVTESTNVYGRQAVVSEAADTLTDAGQFDAADALLKAELVRSPTPYYFMSGLAANAKARGDRAAALDWAAFNAPHRHGAPAAADRIPGPAAEAMLYQTLVGAWPPALAPDDAPGLAALTDRVERWQLKALREAKRDTDWLEPNLGYEAGCAAFLRAIMTPRGPDDFAHRLHRLVARIAPAGIVNSLSQAALRLLSPGVPDLYQGAQTWDHTLVDPDNRADVPFARYAAQRIDAPVAAYLRDWADGRVKHALIGRLLALRAAHPETFAAGAYVPLHMRGTRRGHALAFARRDASTTIVVIATRLAYPLLGDAPARPCVEAACWADTAVGLAPGFAGPWRDVLNDGTLDAPSGMLPLAAALAHLPVAVLIRTGGAADTPRRGA